MRILFVGFAQPGHINPIIPVAQRLHRDGHEVAFFAYDSVRARLDRAGLPVRTYSVNPAPDPVITPPRARRTRALADRMRDPRWVKRWTQLNLISCIPAQIEAIERACDELQPDVICADPLNYAGPVVADRRGIPWAGLATNLMPLAPAGYSAPFIDIHDSLVEERDTMLGSSAHRLCFRMGDVISPYLNTVFATEAFVPRALSGNDWSHIVGPSTPLERIS